MRRRRQARPKQEPPAHPVELVLENAAHGGAVTAHGPDGHMYFVRYGIPGERVLARVTSPQSKFSWAEVETVLESSPLRVGNERDSVADLQHVSRPGQLRWKQDVLTDQLRRVGGRQVREQVTQLYPGGMVPVHPAPGDSAEEAVWGARTRAKFRVTRAGELAVRGYRSHRLHPVTDYPLLAPTFAEAGVFADPKWRELWQPGDTVTLLAPTGSAPQVLVGQRAYDLTGAPVSSLAQWDVKTQWGTTRFETNSAGFWQTHRESAALLAERVIAASGDLSGMNIEELYSGAGLFTRFLAEQAGELGRVVTLEGSEQAVADAERNLRGLIGAAPTELFVGTVDGETVAELAAQLPGGPNVVVLDPPREGAGKNVVEAIGSLSCARVVLVSCDPAAGARDLKYFVDAGYQLASLEAWDLFPGTHHLEFIAGLVR